MFLFDTMVLSLQGPLIFLVMLKNDGKCLMEMFLAAVFGPELPRRRLLGATRFRCFSLERSILGAFRP